MENLCLDKMPNDQVIDNADIVFEKKKELTDDQKANHMSIGIALVFFGWSSTSCIICRI